MINVVEVDDTTTIFLRHDNVVKGKVIVVIPALFQGMVWPDLLIQLNDSHLAK